MRRFAVAALVLLMSAPAFAWGEKGHYITNEAAVMALPNDMPSFFYQAYSDLVWLGFDPDRWRSGGESIEAMNPPDHFLDYEYVRGLQLPPDRYAFITLLGRSGTLRRHGITITTPGFLPWRIAELADTLTIEFRIWRSLPPNSIERGDCERDIIHLAGILGHFAGDSANPEHTTTNFNGWLDPNPNHYPIDCNAHSRFENDFVSHSIETKDVAPLVAAPVLRTDYFAAAMDSVRASNAEVERLYTIDRDGGFDTMKPVKPEAKAFASARLAAGAALLRDLWWSAWRNSATPATPRRSRRGAGSQNAPQQKANPTND